MKVAASQSLIINTPAHYHLALHSPLVTQLHNTTLYIELEHNKDTGTKVILHQLIIYLRILHGDSQEMYE